MNQLDFSPITEKDQESIDTLSFLHHGNIQLRHKHIHNITVGAKKIFDRLCRINHNRQSYGFQLMKQFILFSSDEQTIQIHYKYMQYQIQQGTQHLENTYGMHVKLTLGKAFEDLRNYSYRKKVYHNPTHIQSLTLALNNIINSNKQQNYRTVIKILAKFIQKQANNHKTVENTEIAKDLITSLQNEIKSSEKIEEKAQFQQTIPEQQLTPVYQPKIKYKKSKKVQQSSQQKDRKIRRTDLIKTAKFTTQYNEKPSNQNSYHYNDHSNWKHEVEDVDSYQEQPYEDNPRIIIKSMSNQLGVYPPLNTQFLQYTRHKNNRLLARQNKCMSTQMTPLRQQEEYDIFRTKRRNQQASISEFQNQRTNQSKIVQNIVIIRSSKQHKRQPDRYIRVPITSQQVKIIELLPDKTKNKSRKHTDEYNKKMQTVSSRHKSSSNDRKSEQSSRSQRQSEINRNGNLHDSKQIKSQRKKYNQDRQNMNRSRSRQEELMQQKWDKEHAYEESQTHECNGCKYCLLIKQMQNYRLKRATIKPLALL